MQASRNLLSICVFLLLLASAPVFSQTISSLGSSSGYPGAGLIISGTGFGSAQGSSTVQFNSTTATIASWSDTSINVVIPDPGVSGSVGVSVTVSGSQSNTAAFTVLPIITGSSPLSGPIGTVVDIRGFAFGATQGSGGVTIGGTPVTVNSWSNQNVQVTVPAGATSGVVQLTTGSGLTTVINTNWSFTIVPPPVITSISPTSGGAGTAVTITGSNFGSTQQTGIVSMNGAQVAVASWSDSSITVTIPASAYTGNLSVQVAGGVTSNGVAFTVQPSITSLGPNSGAIGSFIRIVGSSMGGSSPMGTVSFNGTNATVITNWNPTSITAQLPPGATTGNVVLTSAGGTASNALTFTVVPPPAITSISPGCGATGSSVVISGTNFGIKQLAASVTFNGKFATIASWTDTSITATVPSTATTGNVIVKAAGSVTSPGVPFTVTSAPCITSLTPDHGAASTSVVIAGSNFGSTQGTSSVTFNGTSASVTSWSNTSITASVPAGATTGNLVVTAGGVASNGVNFTVAGPVFNGAISYAYDDLGRLAGVVAASGDAAKYSYDAVGNITSITRYISSQEALFTFTPKSGPVGTQVTIAGANFSSIASQDAVSFNGTNAAIISASVTSLVVSVPAGATTGSITVTSPVGSVTTSDPFTVTADSGAPVIASFTPHIVSAGNSVTITGQNFDPDPLKDRLIINTTAGLEPTAATTTSLTITVPSGNGSGQIIMRTSKGVATSTDDLFIPPPGYTVSQVQYTGRTQIGASTSLSVPAQNIGMLIFDGTAGRSFSALVTSSTFSNNCNLQIYLPDNSLMANTTTTCNNTGFLDSTVLPVTGTYTVLIAPNGTVGGSLTLAIYDSTDATGAITLNGPSATIATTVPGQNAKFTFAGTASQLVSALVDNDTYPQSVNISIISPSGVIVNRQSVSGTTFIDDVAECQNGPNAILNLPAVIYVCPPSSVPSQYKSLPETGTYTLLVDASGAITGQLRIRLFAFSSDVNVSTAAGNANTAAIPVSLASPGQNARLSFTGNQNGRVSFAFSGATFNSSTGVMPGGINFVLLGTTGNPLGNPSGYGQMFSYTPGISSGYVEFANNVVFPTTGTYSLWIDPINDTTGSLNVNIYDATDASVSVQADGTSHTLTTTAPGQNMAFNFPATQGQRVTAVVSNLSGFTTNGLSVNILRQGGNGIGSAVQDGVNYFVCGNNCDAITLSATDTYTIYIDPAGRDVGSATATIYTVLPDITGSLDGAGGAVTVTTTTPGQNGRLTFTANAGQTVRFTVSNGTFSSQACNVGLLYPDGSVYVTGLLGIPFTMDCGTSSTSGQLSLNQTGTYTVTVDPKLSATGSVTVSAVVQ